jgi:hypothetical protein
VDALTSRKPQHWRSDCLRVQCSWASFTKPQEVRVITIPQSAPTAASASDEQRTPAQTTADPAGVSEGRSSDIFIGNGYKLPVLELNLPPNGPRTIRIRYGTEEGDSNPSVFSVIANRVGDILEYCRLLIFCRRTICS